MRWSVIFGGSGKMQDEMEQKKNGMADEMEQGIKNRTEKAGILAGRLVYLPLSFLWMEFVLRLCIYRKFPEGTLRAVLFAGAAGCVATMLTVCFPKAVNAVLGYGFLTAGAILYGTQIIYYTIFRRFLSFRVAAGVGTDVLEFKQQIIHTIGMRWYGIVLLLVPLVLRVLLQLSGVSFAPVRVKILFWPLGTAAVLYLCFFGSAALGGREEFSAWDLYFHAWDMELGTQQLGLFVATGKDLLGMVFPKTKSDGLDILGGTPTIPVVTPPPGSLEVSEDGQTPGSNVPGTGENLPGTDELTPTPTPLPVYHAQYDFAALAEQETNEEVKKLHSYFAGLSPEAENEYTGMFQGYNLIMITAEGFSPWAVDEELTPTLYKLTHHGFVFENFYTPLWHTSTSDGEYIACTGLVPDGAHSMRRSSNNDMRFAFGNQFAALGYKTMAYHNNTYTYYDRDKSHPNLGYTYKAIGNGLKLPSNVWPRSDYEMMQASLPEYIGDEPFHVYYMTVSGHMEYTFQDNTMANRNRDVVAGLPYSDHARAYIACNYELEKALTYLLEGLESAGIADHTVIAMYADHYPYGLEKECIDELAGHVVEEQFELYKNHFVLYCPGMKEKVVVKKYCSSLDVAPTISNLFGLVYDSRLFAGSDIFSDKEGLVIFDNKRFITDRVMYDAARKKAVFLTGDEVTQDYLDQKLLEVKQKFAMSKGILDYNYYSYLP